VKDFRGAEGVKHQTDRTSATIVALYGLFYEPPVTPLLSESEDALKELVRLREALVKERASWKNRAQDALTEEGYERSRRIIKRLSDEITDLQKEIDGIIKKDAALRDQVRCLCVIHGIGRVTARTISSELGLLTHYRREDLVGVVGLYPVMKESGSSVKTRPRLAKEGGGRVRRVLYMCAVSLLHSPGPYDVFINRLRKAGKTEMCIIGALMRKILTVARAVMKQGGVYDEHRIGRMKVTRHPQSSGVCRA
jgi:transposase